MIFVNNFDKSMHYFSIAFYLVGICFFLLYQILLRRCSRTWHCFLCIIYNSVPIFLEDPLSLYLLTVVKRPVFYRIAVYSLTLRHFLGQRHTYNHFSDSRIDRSSSVIVWRSKQSWAISEMQLSCSCAWICSTLFIISKIISSTRWSLSFEYLISPPLFLWG